MRRKGSIKIWLGALAVVALAVLAALFIFLMPTAEEVEEPPATGATVTAHDAWYTEAQAEQGQEEYERHCARCHGIDLAGLGPNPPLAGDGFMSRWQGESVARLFQYTRSMMPLDHPASLEDDSYISIIAYVLSVNGFPAGAKDLPADPAQLRQLVIPEPAEGVPNQAL